MIDTTIFADDRIVVNTVESYMKLNRVTSSNPQEAILQHTECKKILYSKIAERLPNYAAYILNSKDIESDDVASALMYAIMKHCKDPQFIDVCMERLTMCGNPEYNGVVGGLFAIILTKLSNELCANETTATKAVKKDEKNEKAAKNETVEQKDVPGYITYLQSAISALLGPIAETIKCKLPSVTKEKDILAIAASIAMGGELTLIQLINSDLPITADVLDVIVDPGEIIKRALLLEKVNYVKVSKNQEDFIASLRRWVYKKLNTLTPNEMISYFVGVYGTVSPEKMDRFVIEPKDCKSEFPNLYSVAKQFFINKK